MKWKIARTFQKVASKKKVPSAFSKKEPDANDATLGAARAFKKGLASKKNKK